MQPPLEDTATDAPDETGTVEATSEVTPEASTETPEKEEAAPDYDALTAPEGLEVGDDAVNGVREFAKAEGLPLDVAQKLIARDAQLVANFERAGEEAMQREADDWISAAKKDPVIGGEHFPRTERRAEELLSKFGPPGFYQRLKDTKFLYVPEFLSTLNAIAAATEEPRGMDVKAEPAPARATDRDIFSNSKSMFQT